MVGTMPYLRFEAGLSLQVLQKSKMSPWPSRHRSSLDRFRVLSSGTSGRWEGVSCARALMIDLENYDHHGVDTGCDEPSTRTSFFVFLPLFLYCKETRKKQLASEARPRPVWLVVFGQDHFRPFFLPFCVINRSIELMVDSVIWC